MRVLPAFVKYIAICVPNTGNPFAEPLFPRRPSWKPSPLRPVISGQGRLSPFLPAENRCLFNFHPAGTTHAQKTDSAWKQKKGRPPWQTAVLEVRCLVQVLFMRRGFEKPPALYKANCVPLSCGMYCPAGTGKVPGHSPPVCVFLSSIQTLSGSLYKKHTEISQIQ